MAYFDDPDNFAWWQAELEALRLERAHRAGANKKEDSVKFENTLQNSEPEFELAPETFEPDFEPTPEVVEPVFEPVFEPAPEVLEPKPEFEPAPEVFEPEPVFESTPDTPTTYETITVEENRVVEDLPNAEKDEEVYVNNEIIIDERTATREQPPREPSPRELPAREAITAEELEKDAMAESVKPSRKANAGPSHINDSPEREPITYDQLEKDALNVPRLGSPSKTAISAPTVSKQPAAMKR